MKKKTKLLIMGVGFIIMTIIVTNISEESIPNTHKNLIESQGWQIENVEFNKKIFNPFYEEAVNTYRFAGIELKPYDNKTIYLTKYNLEEECGGNSLTVGIFFTDDTIIGSYIHNKGYDPGVTKMENKKDYLQKNGCED